MKSFSSVTAPLSLIVLLAGCQSQPEAINDRIGVATGDAIAANTVMQMVDPWTRGVQDTDLVTPADLDQYRRPANVESYNGDIGAEEQATATTQ